MTFSVAMATYNGSRYLRVQLKSIADQTLRPDELVICDDASSDSTLAIVEEFATHATFPVKILTSTENRGSAATFERAIGACGSEWIALCDQDDRWHENKLAVMRERILASPGAGAFFSDADAISETGTPLDRSIWSSLGFDQHAYFRHPARTIMNQWIVYGATLVFRADLRQLALPLPDASAHKYRPLTGHDAWIGLVIACVADVIAIPDRLIDYRIHAEQQVSIPTGPAAADTAGDSPGSTLRVSRERVIGNLPELETLMERLEAESGRYGGLNASGRDIQAWLEHNRTRVSLPASRWRRVAPIAREAVAGRYREYSRGFRSVARDLLTDAGN